MHKVRAKVILKYATMVRFSFGTQSGGYVRGRVYYLVWGHNTVMLKMFFLSRCFLLFLIELIVKTIKIKLSLDLRNKLTVNYFR